MGKLTTHVLDTAHGRPGSGIAIRLYRCANASRQLLGAFVSNADGRCDAPLLADAALQVGRYELEFAVGDYFAGLGVALAEPRFLDVVSLRFGIADVSAHYHVPLLVSPYSYSTYRGS
ncbi:MAG: hydroxyisourate hydrolase [Gammaproteobacteria bacterium HGW-Gammaproteobacteria-2]|jgi:5-hydroxyisourate hydrolase|nr:MAG: hydroxyisourate hydrolase [Gammaproteobacteria bacterium HGW-Gammaproteobacteria-2]